MNSVHDFHSQSELALATYSYFYIGISGTDFIDSLGAAGFSEKQATIFSGNWRVINQYNHSETTVVTDPNGDSHVVTVSNGLSATVFEEVSSGKRYLAVRGTEPNDAGNRGRLRGGR